MGGLWLFTHGTLLATLFKLGFKIVGVGAFAICLCHRKVAGKGLGTRCVKRASLPLADSDILRLEGVGTHYRCPSIDTIFASPLGHDLSSTGVVFPGGGPLMVGRLVRCSFNRFRKLATRRLGSGSSFGT